ncbi:hypothetical protein [Chitinophaga solisilvae]|uniref:Alkyl hydroperoxide reductase subunit C/ Thiol specific antioxidant domain-containing protein n=1 Tax=Chitinophaga solisilvae TaxID=1233460 RepID=A0A9Q5GU19_9BACT|nr:hypothetical protein [Chitinophaga solisilvae]NSL88819.1 hypothetical protein [Chitinophaga solisilvae]
MKRNIFPVSILLALIVMFFTSCHSGSAKTEDIVQTWMGKKIRFPDNVLCSELGEIKPCKTNDYKKFRVLVYTDSVGCVSCKLRLDEWKRFIKELGEANSRDVDFVFYFNPRKTDNLTELFKREYFRIPVHIDVNDDINRINKFPAQMEYQCFLLDKDNKVMLVGNPTLSTVIWDLYKKALTGQMDVNLPR